MGSVEELQAAAKSLFGKGKIQVLPPGAWSYVSPTYKIYEGEDGKPWIQVWGTPEKDLNYPLEGVEQNKNFWTVHAPDGPTHLRAWDSSKKGVVNG